MALVEIVSGLATDAAVAADPVRHRRRLGQDAGAYPLDAGLHRQSRGPPYYGEAMRLLGRAPPMSPPSTR